MNLIDLFSGCGGFSLGAHRAGFNVTVAVDIDPILTSSFKTNFPKSKLLLRDIGKLNGEALTAAAKVPIDGMFGGPPCQGFSSIGRRQADDPRRLLLRHFFRLVNEVRPKFFVMENVRGLDWADSRSVLDGAISLVKDRYAIFGPHVFDAADFGAATKRKRLFVIGIHKDHGNAISMEDFTSQMRSPANVRAAIGDLGTAISVGEEEGFDVWRIIQAGRPSLYASGLRAKDGRFTGQRQTQHSPKVRRRFEKVKQGSIDTVGRHQRLDWSGQCPTLRAGTGSDKGSYQSVRPLHPDEPRVITVREAARLQGFPDTHRFHPTVWHSFRMIGNSVSPIMAEAIFRTLASKLPSMPVTTSG